MAKQDPGEPLDPVYEYIDEKIKPIKKELRQLEDSLLKTQRIMVRFMILHDSAYYDTIVQRQRPEIANDFFTQLASDASRMMVKAKESQEPLSVYTEFKKLLDKRLEATKIKLTHLS
jgi:hypothetical protein